MVILQIDPPYLVTLAAAPASLKFHVGGASS